MRAKHSLCRRRPIPGYPAGNRPDPRPGEFVSLTGRQGEAECPPGAVGDHAGFGAVAAARAAKCLTHVALGSRSPFLRAPAALWDRRAVEKGHAQVYAAFLDPFEKPFPDTQLAPADEGLRRPPP